MRYLSLFSGIEAATVAWKPLGWECVGFSEIEPYPCSLLAHHYPNIPNLGDVTKITEQQIKDLGDFDLVVFGSPCQDLSVAGARKGFQDGTRSNLFYEAMRVIDYARKHCNTRFALWENVPGAFSSNKGADFTAVVREMAGLSNLDTPKNGWGNTGAAVGENGLLEWRVLDAQYFGLAQRRKRVFAILDTGDWANRPPILFEQESVRGNTPPSRETGQGIAADTQTGVGVQALPINTMTCQGRPSDNGRMGDGIGKSIDPSPTLSTRHHHAVAYGFDSRWYNQTPKELCPTLTATDYKEAKGVISIAGNIIGRSPQNGGNGNGFDEEVCYTLTTADRHAVAFGIGGQDIGHCLRSNASRADKPSSTTYVVEIPTSIIRRLTPTECERLQGFPDSYTQIPYRNKPTEQCPDSPRYKALGNSMAVPVMQWIGRRIDITLEHTPSVA